MTLAAMPKGWFSKSFRVMEGTRQVAEIDMSWWREQGPLTIEGVSYKAYREKLMSGDFLLEAAGRVVARAEKPSAFFRCFLIEFAGRQLMLKAKSVFGREFALMDGQNEIGGIAPKGFFTRRAMANLPDELPLPVRIFILWLTIVLWERESDSGPAAGGAGTA